MSEERWLNEPSIFDDIELLSKPIDELTEEDLQRMPHIALYDSENKESEERKDEYVTLHHEDIHFIDEDAERAFYESLAERKAGEHLLYIPLPHKSERILEKDILAKGAERKEE